MRTSWMVPSLVVVSMLAIASGLLPSVGVAQDDALGRAQAAFLDADFERARREIEEVLRAPSATVETLARAHALSSTLTALEGGDPQPAIERALSLDPLVEPIEGSPRAVTAAFARVRAERGGRRVRVRLAVWSEEARAEITVLDAPDGLVRTLRLRCGAQEVDTTERHLEITLSGAGTCEGLIESEAGVILSRQSERYELAHTSTSGDASEDMTPWIVLGVVGGVLLVGGAIAIGVAVSGSPQSTLGAPVVLEW